LASSSPKRRDTTTTLSHAQQWQPRIRAAAVETCRAAEGLTQKVSGSARPDPACTLTESPTKTPPTRRRSRRLRSRYSRLQAHAAWFHQYVDYKALKQILKQISPDASIEMPDANNDVRIPRLRCASRLAPSAHSSCAALGSAM